MQKEKVGVTSSQQAILQSSHITEDLFRKFERMEQRDFQALLEYSKEAWLTGKKSMYVMPDGTQDFLDIDSMQHMESNYGIFVSDAALRSASELIPPCFLIARGNTSSKNV